MEEKIKELSIYRFDKANKSLLVAEKLFAEGEYGYSQNRAYYALFDAIRSITALDGFDSSKHSGIIAHFNQCYVKTSIFSPNTSSIIRLASMLREKSDYEDFYEPDKEDTKEIIDSVRTFLAKLVIISNNKEFYSLIELTPLKTNEGLLLYIMCDTIRIT